MDELINDFIAETRDMLQALGGEIVAWESAPGDRARLDEIFRFVHTVKGNCGFFDLPRLQALSHAAEDALAEVRAGKRRADPALVSCVLAVIDRIGELVQALETGESLGSEDDGLLIEALRTGAMPYVEASAGEVAIGDARKSQRSIRLSVDLLDRMMSGVSDAVLARNELARRLREAPTDMAVEAAFDRVSTCIAEIRDAITRTRMQRIDNLFAGLPRMVRDIASELNKQVRLQVDGGDVELDREMIEMIRDPLTHMVRNAIDHGIESSEARVAAGKEAVGTLKVCARQSGNQILIEVVDDGRGIDGDRLVTKALANGVLTPERAERLSQAQKISLIFEAGLSTAQEVTAISGRGVGMDVVRANIERIGGLVEVDSKLGQGVRFTIRVPLTLTIIPALTVSAGGQTFAIPRAAIEEILRTGGSAVKLETIGESCIATIRGRRVPLITLTVLLGLRPKATGKDQTIILLKPAGGDVYALLLDAVYDHEELVVKPAAPAIMATGLYAGTTLADDGRPVLLLDPSGIASKAAIAEPEAEREHRVADAAKKVRVEEHAQLLVFRGLDGGRRAVRLAVVERIEDVLPEAMCFTAGRLRIAIDGAILPIAGCTQAPDRDKVRILRLSDGASELAYAFDQVIDILPLTGKVRRSRSPGEIAGVILINGEQVELIDPHWLFAHCDAPTAGETRRICAMPLADPWMVNMLRPLVESLGYDVVAAEEGVEADLLVTSAEAPLFEPPQGAQILRLRATPEPGGDADTIYRYDRAALLDALGAREKASNHG
ncbi:MAG: signal transduction histidine kinase [Alphaproteobacteria bacterium]|jgi:two-component system chemotaxis sensor kinase CheA|nr:signal transduction histidine kinase [Alphaproteobacteria bacterium]